MGDLVVKGPRELAEQSRNDWGLVIEDRSLTIRCEIGQPSSSGKVTGKFNFTGDWSAQDKLTDVVVISPNRTRVLYGPKLTDPRRCGSDDYATPSPFITDPVSKSCTECPLSRWDSDLSDDQKSFKHDFQKRMGKPEGAKPLCVDTINLVVVDSRMVPFTLRFQKTQQKIVQEKLINRIRFKGKRPYQVMFDVTVEKGDSSKGNYFNYVFDNFRDIEESSQGPFKELFEFFADNGQRLMAQQFAAADMEREVRGSEGDSEIPF